ncbi:hypothetical protein HAX54_011522 [Datura stramonium]|uniref:Uncharacterized protein n=1 Tax=Datura stramonium TaxID=4076 RepID=A0ABS8TI88_DATST|nr:hypothetical protein [Datura stramonium]
MLVVCGVSTEIRRRGKTQEEREGGLGLLFMVVRVVFQPTMARSNGKNVNGIIGGNGGACMQLWRWHGWYLVGVNGGRGGERRGRSAYRKLWRFAGKWWLRLAAVDSGDAGGREGDDWAAVFCVAGKNGEKKRVEEFRRKLWR